MTKTEKKLSFFFLISVGPWFWSTAVRGGQHRRGGWGIRAAPLPRHCLCPPGDSQGLCGLRRRHTGADHGGQLGRQQVDILQVDSGGWDMEFNVNLSLFAS